MTTSPNELELALTESRTLRRQHATRTDVLDKVKALTLLPDAFHATKEIVAAYFEVPVTTIESVVEDNREEIEFNGYRVLRGAELRAFAAPFEGAANPVGPKTRSLALFTRRTILNVGQLLRESEVARQVRSALLDVEETAPHRDAVPAIDEGRARRALWAAQFDSAVAAPDVYSYAEVCALLRQFYGIDLSVPQLTRMLRGAGLLRQDGVPRRKYESYFYFADGTWYVLSHMVRRLAYKVCEYGREIQDFRFMQTRLEAAGLPSWPDDEDAARRSLKGRAA